MTFDDCCWEAIELTVAPDLLKNKSRPEEAARNAAEWVVSEREMRERLKREREQKEKLAVSLVPSIIRSTGISRTITSITC